MSGVARTYYPVASLPDTNARQSASTLRPASTALLTIDSEDRYYDYIAARNAPTSPYNFSIRKSESLMAGFMTRLGVSEVCFPWTIPNINLKTRLIQISYVIGPAPVATAVITVPVGFYTPAALAAKLTTLITAAGPAVTVSYGSGGDPYFSYLCAAGTTIAFNPMPYNTAAYPYGTQSMQLFDLLSFTAVNQIQAPAGNGNYSLGQCFRYIDLVCNQLTNSQAQKDQTSQTVARDMLCRLYLGDGGGTGQSTISPADPLFCPPGCAPMVIYRNFTMPKQIQWIPNQNIPGFLQFQVYDDTGDLLDISLDSPAVISFVKSDTNWSMTMLITEN